ncbi:MAG: Crp/Fnr family transcriptional regulator [Cyclobacteriaceae bacterium]
MIIPEEMVLEFGGKLIQYKKNTAIFDQGSQALHYYQVKSGEVKMVNYSPDGQEFIQGFFQAGQSFGEPPIFADFPYPASAICCQDSSVFKLTRDHFFDLLSKHFEIHKKFNELLSRRLQYKGMILNEISSHPPEHRILTLLTFLKSSFSPDAEFEIPYTRQQIADMTGLRVETVIRSVRKMEQSGELAIKNHKITI